jgi:hypothetical protein
LQKGWENEWESRRTKASAPPSYWVVVNGEKISAEEFMERKAKEREEREESKRKAEADAKQQSIDRKAAALEREAKERQIAEEQQRADKEKKEKERLDRFAKGAPNPDDCMGYDVTCTPEQKKMVEKAAENRRKLSGVTYGRFVVNPNEWFAYRQNPTDGFVMLLSHGTCPVKFDAKSPRNAKILIGYFQHPACWSEINYHGSPTIEICRRDTKEMIRDCYYVSKELFLSTQSLPQTGF